MGLLSNLASSLTGIFSGVVGTASQAVGNVLGGVTGLATGVLNSKGGQMLASTAGTAIGAQPVSAAQITAIGGSSGGNAGTGARAINPNQTGKGYDTPIDHASFTDTLFEFNDYNPNTFLYVLDSNGYPKKNWLKIAAFSVAGLGLVYGLYRFFSPKRSSGGGSRRRSSRPMRRR